jgi:hypothetical protein
VSSPTPNEQRSSDVDLALQKWRQGDVALGTKLFTYLAKYDPSPTAERYGQDGPYEVTVEVEGVVVLTQTCDIRRSSSERPYVHVAPLKRVDDAFALEVEKGYRIQYVRIASQPNTVADLDLIATIEKSVVADWDWSPGWSTDEEVRRFADAVARKDSRFAFPDDFSQHTAKRLQRYLREKHGKQNEDGAALRALREIRVTATPSWDADQVEVFFFFVRHDNPEGARIPWPQHLNKWLSLCDPYGKIVSIDGCVSTLEGINAKDYVESDRLDLDHLSGE